jgi:streptomycin 6-kinase
MSSDIKQTVEFGRLSGLDGWIPPDGLLRATSNDLSTNRSVEQVLETVRACANLWNLNILVPYTCLTYNFVAPVFSSEHGDAVLKIGFDSSKLSRELLALSLFDGQGAVKVLKSDKSLSALLLERADPGLPLSLDWDQQTAAFAGLLKDLWREAPEEVRLPTVASELEYRLRDLEDMSKLLKESHFIERDATVQRAINTLVDLVGSSDERYVVHGDLHAGNVLSSRRSPWLSVDPIGCVGERAFDVCALLRDNHRALHKATDPQELVCRRVRELSMECGIDDQRIRAWSFVEAVRIQGWRYKAGKSLEEWSSIIALVEPQ